MAAEHGYAQARGAGTIGAVGGTLFELGTDGPTRIMVGVDGSETSMRAGAYAAGMARRQGSRLIAVYVIPTATISAQLAQTAAAMIQTHDEVARQLRIAVEEGAAHIGITAGFVLRRGNPYRELLAVADEMRVDAVVVGASMQSGRRFVGSLAARLVKDAKWPITVVP
jgi:nucleotide-binding universal stress UspA family protein